MMIDRFMPRIVQPKKSKFNPNSYSVEWTKQGTCMRYYADGRITLNYSIPVVVELPKKLSKQLNKIRDRGNRN